MLAQQINAFNTCISREGGKAPLLQFLQQCLCSPSLPLPTLGTILGNVVGALQAHLKQVWHLYLHLKFCLILILHLHLILLYHLSLSLPVIPSTVTAL